MARGPKMARGKISLAHGIHCSPSSFLFLLLDQRLCIVKNARAPVCVCVCVCIYIYIHTYISDCVEIVYELPLLPNNTASEPFLHKSGAVGSVEVIFSIGVPAWR